VPQEAEVFEASVRENLTFGATHSNDAIERAAYLSAFDSVLAALPQGLETPISERGFNLSGGQRQRLALARGFLAADVEGAHDNSLLLLDEPTSALDQVSEARIFRRLRERLPEACVIASVHRMSVLAQFDKVVLMQDGRILDCGTANELRLRQPLMRQMMEGAEALKGAA
jgi:ABC-type bacteriocin/lantibiotic exporter with double-glycine peptidase domain